MSRWLTILIAVLLLLTVLLVQIWRCGDSTCAVLYGPAATWRTFALGFQSVYPNAQVIVVRDPEIDFTAYCDALEACDKKFSRLVCQVPCKRAAEILSSRTKPLVAIASPPENLPRSAVCNIVRSEQLAASLLIDQVKLLSVDGKKVVLSSTEVSTPSGWTQLRTSQAVPPQTALQQVGGTVIAAVVMTDFATAQNIEAVALAAPGARLFAVTPEIAQVGSLSSQVAEDGESKGRLAAAMLAGPYFGPREVTVDPLTIKPKPSVERAEVTSLCQLR